MTTRHHLRAVLLLSLGLPGVAWAQPAVAPSPTATSTATHRETARTWVQEGRRLFKQQDYAGALERYTAAYQLVRAPTVGFEVAVAQEVLGKWVEANATAVEVLNLPVTPEEPAVFGAARDSAKQLLRRLTPLIPTLDIEVAPGEAVARIEIDGEHMPAPRRLLSFKINPGRHELLISAPGYQTAKRSIALREQERQTLSVALVPEPQRLAAPSVPAAAPTPTFEAAAADPREPASASPTLGYVALGTAGVAALVGGVTGTLAFTTKPSCPDNHCRPEQRKEANASRRSGNVATISFGVAFVAGAYGLWELLHTTPKTTAATGTSAGARVLPVRSGAVLEVSGTLPL